MNGVWPLCEGIVLDHRRAVWFPDTRTLAVADLHLGYAWVHRQAGHLLPVVPEDTLPRLEILIQEYQPAEVVLLGDIVHKVVQSMHLRKAVHDLAELFAKTNILGRWVAGNHDRLLGTVLPHWTGDQATLISEYALGPHLLLHGDVTDEEVARQRLDETKTRGGWIVMGHEHPATSLSDGVATHAKVPCFLASENLLILPAFSPWAAGHPLKAKGCLSAYGRLTAPHRVFAVIAGRILPMQASTRCGSAAGAKLVD